jgi:hypothetical protein
MSAHRRQLVDCVECGASRFQGKGCPACGWRPQAKAEPVEVVDEDLVLRERGQLPAANEWTNEMRREWHAELLGRRAEINQKPRRQDRQEIKLGWVAHKYREKFGSFPPWSWRTDQARDPSPATRAWVTSRDIARRLATQKAGKCRRAN